jgi:2-phospho-L-lactate guanylyltransferase (CobY/MobA/RfbA family)
MTLVVVLADPPRAGLVLPRLAETTPLSAAEVTDCYRAMLADTLRAAEGSGGELLVNYRPDEALPEKVVTDEPAEESVRAVADQALTSLDGVRFETQVGSTFDGRVGNSVTHLLKREEQSSVLVLDGTTPLVGRKDIDNCAMKLRRSDVVLGPSSGGRVYGAAFGNSIDFDGAYSPPAVETLTDRALDAGLDVDFLPSYETVETGADLCSVVSLLRARLRAGRIVPKFTTEFVDELGLDVRIEDGAPTLVRQ